MHPSEVVQVNIAQSEHLVSPENSLNKLVQIKQDLDFYKYNKYAYQKEDIMEFFQHLVEINSPPDIIQTYKQKLIGGYSAKLRRNYFFDYPDMENFIENLTVEAKKLLKQNNYKIHESNLDANGYRGPYRGPSEVIENEFDFNTIGVPYTRGPYRGPKEVAENKREPKNFKCEKCDKTFTTKQNFIEHENVIHKGLKLHKCEICDKTFRWRNYLYAHKKSEHPKIPNILSKKIDTNEDEFELKMKFTRNFFDPSIDIPKQKDRNEKFSKELKLSEKPTKQHGAPLKIRHWLLKVLRLQSRFIKIWQIQAKLSHSQILVNLSSYFILPNNRVGPNKRVGYYIELFGHYIKNYFLFNKNI